MPNWKQFCVRQDTTLHEVIRVIDEGSAQIALVVEDNAYKLIGTVTDGDVRRGLLRGLNMQSTVTEIMNTQPFTLQQSDDQSRSAIRGHMMRRKIHQIPVVNKKGEIEALYYNDMLGRPKENEVVLMVGGLGSRLGELTKDCPKPMLEIGNKPILQTVIERFATQGFYKFTLAVNYKAAMIEDYFGDGSEFGVEINYVRETKRLGTAGALSLLETKPEKPFIVMNGDLLTRTQFDSLIDFHEDHGADATMCVREYNFQVPFGVVEVEGHRLNSIVEKPEQSFFVNAGMYALTPECCDLIPQNDYYDMPTLFEDMREKGMNVSAFPIREYWIDIGRVEELKKAEREFENNFSGVEKELEAAHQYNKSFEQQMIKAKESADKMTKHIRLIKGNDAA